MRKTVVILMLVLPLLFVFAVFSSGQTASLGVDIAANGIEILNAPEGGVLAIDIADFDGFAIDARVSPENATDKGVTYRVEQVEGAQLADVRVDKEGNVTAYTAGSARVVAITDDGGYTDSFVVAVSSSKPYDFDITLSDADGNNMLVESDGVLSAAVESGRYDYRTSTVPAGFAEAQVEVVEGFAELKANTALFPFEGVTKLRFTVKGGAFGDIVRDVEVATSAPETVSGIVVNGVAEAALAIEKGGNKAYFFVAANDEIEVKSQYISSKTITRVQGAGEHCYRVDLTLSEDRPDEFDIEIAGGAESVDVSVTSAEFAFSVTSTLPVQGADAVILTGSEVTFFAVPSVIADDVEYEWRVEDATSDDITVTPQGDSCTIGASGAASFKLVVTPMRGGYPMDVFPVEIAVTAIDEVTSVQIANKTDVGLLRELAVPGKAYADGKLVSNALALEVRTFLGATAIDAAGELEFTLSDPALASLAIDGDDISLVPLGNGYVTVTAEWKGNGAFGRQVRSSLTVRVAADAVGCSTSQEVFKAADAGLAIVLEDDIMLGEEYGGNIEAMRARLGTTKSTYNTEFYSNLGNEDAANVSFVLELKNDLYGNGHTLNAQPFTTAKDGSGVPLLFKGPLYFVRLGEIASVAGQDNIAFLVRTDGVEISNATLLGCGDDLLEEDGQYKLEKLNNVGTVLDINADCTLSGCRVRNGRTVVRVYGGNTSGDDYMRDTLDGSSIADRDRAIVTIDRCLISQGREFLVKLGVNRALASDTRSSVEPDLVDDAGKPYSTMDDSLWQDEYFYDRYVMSDLTLRDSVLETSGLFSIGVESNFAGTVLAANSAESGIEFDGWPGTGGTSFASVLRLEGDVRMYDWKGLDLIDSSTLIDSNGVDGRFSLDLGGMLRFAAEYAPDKYGDIIQNTADGDFVHGGIALYGGGKNYAQVVTDGLDENLCDFKQYRVNISILAESDDDVMIDQGGFLPLAAGSQDFRFFMYSKDSANNFDKQKADAANGIKYDALYGIGR